jgi:hypothetical protein
MEDESMLLKGPNQVAGKVFDADEPVTLVAGSQLHAMRRDDPTRFHDPKQTRYQELEVLKKLVICPAISQIGGAVAVAIQIGEWRRKHAEVNAVFRQVAQHLA